eukprot:NODE_2721_length_1135_cov_22.240331_g2499_i0.p1 GENE.NODE_2721_length_1135_cov_22.240331_g2499_i0~~NODE_2721_length_1135_cov_22.240331_g2499_i0.p1  ORF type:complete len:305 (-),score=88.18 NODE_2721_length_1135_cov_22.240331_g2499_i0:170-1084(-)
MADEGEALLKELGPGTQEALRKIFQWAKKKRVLHVKDIEGEFFEYRAASLLDDSYNKADVTDILNSLLAILKVTIEKEQRDSSLAFGEIVKQILVQADKAGTPIDVDVIALDTPSVLGRMGSLEKSLPGLPGIGGLGGLGKPGGLAPKPAALAPIGSTPPAPTGPSENEIKVAEENEKMKDKLNKIQQQYTTMMQEKTKQSQELAKLKDSASAGAAADSVMVAKKDEEIANLKAQLERKESDIASSQKELTGKISESRQFTTLKKLLAQKTQQVKELRTQLQKYVPEAGATVELVDESSSEDDA